MAIARLFQRLADWRAEIEMLDSSSLSEGAGAELSSFNRSAPRRRVWIVLGLLVATHAGFNACLSPFGASADAYPQLAAYLAIGVVFFQPVLFAAWAVLSTQPAVWRFPGAILGCALTALAALAGREQAASAAIEGTVFTLVVFAITACLLLPLRYLFGWKIEYAPESAVDRPAVHNRFSIRFLMGWMAAAAVVLAIGREVFVSETEFDGNTNLTIWQRLVSVFDFTMLVLLIAIPPIVVPWTTLAFKRGGAIWLLIAYTCWGLMSLAAVLLFLRHTPASFGESAVFVVLLQVGATLAGLVTVAPIRWCGYRLTRAAKRRA